nr:MAG TPA: hypothetical protein [Caudoviricetes sp.]
MTAVWLCMYRHKKCPKIFEPITETLRNGQTIMLFRTAKLRQNFHVGKKITKKIHKIILILFCYFQKLLVSL